jgi:hypothetical protein
MVIMTPKGGGSFTCFYVPYFLRLSTIRNHARFELKPLVVKTAQSNGCRSTACLCGLLVQPSVPSVRFLSRSLSFHWGSSVTPQTTITRCLGLHADRAFSDRLLSVDVQSTESRSLRACQAATKAEPALRNWPSRSEGPYNGSGESKAIHRRSSPTIAAYTERR